MKRTLIWLCVLAFSLNILGCAGLSQEMITTYLSKTDTYERTDIDKIIKESISETNAEVTADIPNIPTEVWISEDGKSISMTLDAARIFINDFYSLEAYKKVTTELLEENVYLTDELAKAKKAKWKFFGVGFALGVVVTLGVVFGLAK